ncbi:hypothetical protein BH09BAC1_BH09BAC1_14240 [soil metagenome]
MEEQPKPASEKLIVVLKWFFSISFLLAIIGALSDKAVVAAMAFLVIGLLLLPPLKARINSIFPFMAKRPVKLGVLVFVIVVAAFGMPKPNSAKGRNTTHTATSTKPSKPVKAVEKKPEMTLLQELEREIKSFDKPFDGSTYRGDVGSLQLEIVLFSVWGSMITEGEASSDATTQKAAKDLKKKASALQAKELPLMRKDYCKVLYDKMWEHNIYFSTEGSKHTILNVTGSDFANNANIKEYQNTLQEILTMFRFKQVRYRWYKGADDYQYYKLDVPADSEVVKL